jgi:energy-coupling factor transporter ATP-binding protein EcfA2
VRQSTNNVSVTGTSGLGKSTLCDDLAHILTHNGAVPPRDLKLPFARGQAGQSTTRKFAAAGPFGFNASAAVVGFPQGEVDRAFFVVDSEGTLSASGFDRLAMVTQSTLAQLGGVSVHVMSRRMLEPEFEELVSEIEMATFVSPSPLGVRQQFVLARMQTGVDESSLGLSVEEVEEASPAQFAEWRHEQEGEEEVELYERVHEKGFDLAPGQLRVVFIQSRDGIGVAGPARARYLDSLRDLGRLVLSALTRAAETPGPALREEVLRSLRVSAEFGGGHAGSKTEFVTNAYKHIVTVEANRQVKGLKKEVEELLRKEIKTQAQLDVYDLDKVKGLAERAKAGFLEKIKDRFLKYVFEKKVVFEQICGLIGPHIDLEASRYRVAAYEEGEAQLKAMRIEWRAENERIEALMLPLAQRVREALRERAVAFVRAQRRDGRSIPRGRGWESLAEQALADLLEMGRARVPPGFDVRDRLSGRWRGWTDELRQVARAALERACAASE